MASPATRQSADTSAGLSLKNSLRFELKDKGMSMPNRVAFGRDVLFEALKLKPEDIFCLQQNSKDLYYDVTFHTSACMEEARELALQRENPALMPFHVMSLSKKNFRILTVHMFNPWVREETVRYFLGRHVKVLPGVKEIKDALGIWTGKRQFRVQLKEDTNGHDGFTHSPAAFTIG